MYERECEINLLLYWGVGKETKAISISTLRDNENDRDGLKGPEVIQISKSKRISYRNSLQKKS